MIEPGEWRWDPSWRAPSVQITAGAQHLRDAEPPPGWRPPAPVGFAPPPVAEPLTWDGDQA